MSARILFTKDTIRSSKSTKQCWQTGHPFNVHPTNGTHSVAFLDIALLWFHYCWCRSFSFIWSTRLQGNIIGWEHGCATDAMPSAGEGRNIGIWPWCRWQLTYSSRKTLRDLQCPPTNTSRRDTQFNVHPRYGTQIDESPCLWNTRMRVCSLGRDSYPG